GERRPLASSRPENQTGHTERDVNYWPETVRRTITGSPACIRTEVLGEPYCDLFLGRCRSRPSCRVVTRVLRIIRDVNRGCRRNRLGTLQPRRVHEIAKKSGAGSEAGEHQLAGLRISRILIAAAKIQLIHILC